MTEISQEQDRVRRARRSGNRGITGRAVPTQAVCFTENCGQPVTGMCIQCGRPHCAEHGGPWYGQRCRECYEQMALILVQAHYRAGQLPEAAALLGGADAENATPESLYYRGLALAANGDFDGAEACLQQLITRPGGGENYDESARQVLAKILSARAARHLQAENIVGAADDLRQAVALSKDTAKQYSLLMALTLQAGFAYLQAGRFTDALREWRETQQQDPQNLQVAHSLAVVSYRLACEAEANHDPQVDTYWHEAIANWVVVISSDAFWSAWGSGRSGAMGPLDDSLVKEVREKTGARLRDDFREFRAQYLADESRSADADRHARYEADFLREQHAAEAMLAAIQKGNPAQCPVKVACGPLMLARWRQIPNAARLVDAVNALVNLSPDLGRYLSDLGAYHMMIHELKRYEDARTGLESMISSGQKSDEVVALLVEAYLAQARELVEVKALDRALPLLESAVGYRRDQAMPLLVEVAIKQARALYDDKHVQQGIDLMDRLARSYSISDPEFKAEHSRGYFERGLERNHADNNPGALQDLRRALEINPNNERAKQNMAAVMMNVAADELKADRTNEAFRLVNEMLGMQLPNMGEYREFISIVLFRHGIDMANKAIGAVQYSPYKRGACPDLQEAKNQLQLALELAKPDDYTYRSNIQKQLASINSVIAQIGCW